MLHHISGMDDVPRYLDELEVARETAKEAGDLLLKLFGKVEIGFKTDKSIVTEADLQSEKLIRSLIRQEYPEHDILGEEMGRSGDSSPYLWVIDSLDGTTNYSIRNPFFDVSIALTYNAEPVVGVVYYPFGGELFHAVRGGGAYLNDESIRVSRRDFNSSILTFCNNRDQESVKRIVDIFGRLKPVNNKFRQFGAGALELSYVACGRADAFLMVGANPWDVAAGVLLVREAGGIATDFQGMAYNINSKDLLAANRMVHSRLLEVVGG